MRILCVSLVCGALLVCPAVFSDPTPVRAGEAATRVPSQAVVRFQHHLADYDAEPRLPNGRVDVDGLVARLRELGVTSYYWLIWHAATDWDDLKLFLPKAAEAKLEVWVYLVPPSESPPHTTLYSEPFRVDYQRWAEEIARLSLQHPNLTAWVIDDFYANHQLFTPAYIRKIQSRAHETNPRLAFLPLMYFGEVTPHFVGQYRADVDGVVVAYPRDRREIDCAGAILSGATAVPGQIGCPWATPSSAGDFAAATVSAKVLPSNCQIIRFRERDDFTGPTAGYHFKQLLIDDKVLWEEGVAGGKLDWRDVMVDISRQVRGNANVVVTFRLFDKKGVSNFGVRWDLADLQAEGLQTAADLREPQKWQASRRGVLESGFGVATQRTASHARVPFIVMTAADAGEFRMRHGDPASPERIADWLRMCLQAEREGKCDGVVTYCLDKGPQSKAFPLVTKLFGEYHPIAK